ncbi:MAG: NrdH-redoxin [candidate division Zixibacteria bacterium]|nr:NrdH-redoxin [Gammaproteobacteria bacterium]NIX59303.1 NrdH-redoxin [candidate division Zixibacteria bacterium]
MSRETVSQVRMYSTSWCPDCIRAKAVMKRLKVDFTEIDVDQDREGYRIVVEYNNGRRVVPTIFFPDGSVLVEPSNKTLSERLISLGLVKES